MDCVSCIFSGTTVNVHVQLEREDEVAGPVIAPLFPQVQPNLQWFHTEFYINFVIMIKLKAPCCSQNQTYSS